MSQPHASCGSLDSRRSRCTRRRVAAQKCPVIFVRMLLTSRCSPRLVLLLNGESCRAGTGLAELRADPDRVGDPRADHTVRWWLVVGAEHGRTRPSERERSRLPRRRRAAAGDTPARPLRLPERWFVLDEPQPDAAVCGDTLMLSRGLLESEYLPAVLAHELGHLASSDGKLTAAINRLVLRPVRKGQTDTAAPAAPIA